MKKEKIIKYHSLNTKTRQEHSVIINMSCKAKFFLPSETSFLFRYHHTQVKVDSCRLLHLAGMRRNAPLFFRPQQRDSS